MEIKPIFKGKNVLPIVFAFNDEYSKYFSVALQSLIENSSKNYNYDIVALISNVQEDNKKTLLKMIPNNFSLRFFNMKEYLPVKFKDIELKTLKYYSEDIYYRLFIPFLFKNYEKVIYLDSDIVVEEDIANLYMDLENYKIAAALDTIVPFLELRTDRLEHMKNILNLRNENLYFNSGVLLFNLKNISLSEYVSNLLKALQIDDLLFPDQDILNTIFQDKVKFLPRKWNFNSSPYVNDDFYEQIKGEYKDDFLSARKKPSLIHYTSHYKPWNNNKNPNYEIFWKYARKTPFYEEILYARNQAMIVKSTRFIDLYFKIKNSSNIVFWGASLFLKEFLQMYNIDSTDILGIIDTNPKLWQEKMSNYTIYSPKDLKKLNPDVVIITIINADYRADIQEFIQNEQITTELLTVF